MKRRGFLKKLGACLLACAMLVSAAMPVSAASYKKGQSKMVDTGQSYHLMNNNISGNRITRYTIGIQTLESGTRFDLAVAYNGREELLRNCSKSCTVTNTQASYVKSSSKSNTGMLACIRVHKGSVLLKVQYYTGSSKAALSFKKQASSHQTLKSVTVKTNQKVFFQQQGSNISKTAVVMGATKTGTISRRALNAGSTTYENYTFNSGSVSYRYYKNGVLQSAKSKNPRYDTTYGSSKYIRVLFKERASGWLTTKRGTVTYFYPTDYVNIQVSRK